jgi:hypothetical protein
VGQVTGALVDTRRGVVPSGLAKVMQILASCRVVRVGIGVVMVAGLGACAASGSAGGGAESPDSASVPPRSKPGDKSATQNIDQAVNELYLGDQHAAAEGELIGIVEGCRKDCSAEVKARGWMYIGIVRGSGANDQDGARDAFQRAVAEDPRVQIDEALATPDTLRTFEAVQGGAE